MKKTILSGIRPTGRLHIGNYFGSLANFIELQKNHNCYFFIADLHSLNESLDPKAKSKQIIDIAKTYLAAGLDPKKCTLFIQSHVPEHSECATIFSNFVPASFLFRMTQYKDKSSDRSNDKINAGLLYYPILMSADILLYRPDQIPVGQDQTQHVELSRDVARFVNGAIGTKLPEPKPLYTQTPKVMSLIDPTKKMSKSLGENHCIYIDDDEKTISKKLSKAPTDSGDATSVGGKNLLDLIKIFNQDAHKKYSQDAKNKSLRYGDLKKQLATEIADYFADFRKAKDKISDKKALEVFVKGSKKAQKTASKTLSEIRQKIGLQ